MYLQINCHDVTSRKSVKTNHSNGANSEGQTIVICYMKLSVELRREV
jgi:hypothetical protein